MKTCLLCRETKPYDDFSKHRSTPDGRQYECRACRRKRCVEYESRPEVAKYKREYRAANADAKRAYDRARYEANRDKAISRAKSHYDRNRAARIAAITEYQKSNIEMVRITKRNAKAKRRAVEASGVRAADLIAWTKKQEKVCAWCGCECADTFHIDHRIALAKGGAHDLPNLVIACRPCNLRKSARDPEEFKRLLDSGFYEKDRAA